MKEKKIAMTGIVLAGGKNSRMGIDKAFIKINGSRMIDKTMDIYSQLFAEILIVTNDPLPYLEFSGATIVTDIYKGKGPLGGIYTGLFYAKNNYTFACSCDMPFLNEAFIAYMIGQLGKQDVIVPELPEGYQPLHAIYSRNCLPSIRRLILMDKLKITGFYRDMRVLPISEERIRPFNEDGSLFQNLNTPEELEKVQQAGERILELEKEETEALEKVLETGLTLSASRRQAAVRMGQEVEGELNDLNLAGARFSVSFNPPISRNDIDGSGKRKIDFRETGLDEVEFLIAPNPGEGLKPLVKIASGGETSRLMLALKNVLAQADRIPTLIFDEIDQGIGGRVGFVVGEKMWQLARRHQVMCVTHLPQLAAFGDEHYKVSKSVVDERTLTSVAHLGTEERIVELALMNGNTSASNLAAAREILDRAHERQAES